MKDEKMKDEKIKEVESKVRVNKIFKKSGKLVTEDNSEEVVFVVKIPENAAYVTLCTDKKKTKNLGNYESCSASVFLSVPCPLDEGQMDLAFEFIDNYTTKKLKEVLGEK